MRQVSLHDLTTGVTVARDVYDSHGRLIVPGGAVLTDRHLRGLKMWGVSDVAIENGGEPDVAPTGETLPPELANQVEQWVRVRFSVAGVDHLMLRLLFDHVLDHMLRQDPREARSRLERSPEKLRGANRRKKPDKRRKVPRTARELIEKTQDLPSPPAIYLRLMEVIDHPHSSARDIAEVIGEDSSLTARLLHLVNSSFYALPTPVETISHAVSVVGTEQLSDLALATTVIKSFECIPNRVLSAEAYWQHCFACGIVARALAVHRHKPNAERLFVAGLLHDVGRLLIYAHLPTRAYENLCYAAETRKPLYVAEGDRMPYTHEVVGATLLKTWNMSRRLTVAVRRHHNNPANSEFPVEAAMVHVADILVNAMAWGTTGEWIVPPLARDAWRILDVPVEIVPTILDNAERQIFDVMNIIFKD